MIKITNIIGIRINAENLVRMAAEKNKAY